MPERENKKIMSTQRQKKVARLIIENASLDKPLNAGEILEKVSYGKISKQPSRVFESQGVKDELAVLGFTELNAKTVVASILLNEKADNPSRLKAADQVFKVHGTYAPEKKAVHVDITEIKNKDDDELARLAGFEG